LSGIAGRIGGILEKNTAVGRRPHQVFEDWLDLVDCTLRELPRHAQAVQATGKMAEDTPETAAVFERLRAVYRSGFFDNFAEAFALLNLAAGCPADSAQAMGSGGLDVVGSVYMEFGNPNPHSGQFFTPWSIAYMMGYMLIDDGTEAVLGRLRRAFRRAMAEGDEAQKAVLTAATLTGCAIPDGDGLGYFVKWVWPVLKPFYEPISHCDPAVGSGVMLVATSVQYPAWANALGMVSYYGMDIDATCVKMARINGMLYGFGGPYLFGYGSPNIAGFDSPAEREQVRAMLPQVPEPLNGLYTQALDAAAEGRSDALERLREEANGLRQANLFDV